MKKLFLLSSFIFISLQLSAQPTPPPPSIPIDGGLGFLVAAGVSYGVSRLRKRNQEK